MKRSQLKEIVQFVISDHVSKLNNEENEQMKKRNREKIMNEPIVINTLEKLAKE